MTQEEALAELASLKEAYAAAVADRSAAAARAELAHADSVRATAAWLWNGTRCRAHADRGKGRVWIK